MELLTKCDMLVVENGSCDGTEEYRTQLLNSLASGKLTPAQLDALGDPENMFKGFEQVLGRAVHNKNKKIMLENSPWGDEEGDRFLTFLSIPPRANSLNEALSKMQATSMKLQFWCGDATKPMQANYPNWSNQIHLQKS